MLRRLSNLLSSNNTAEEQQQQQQPPQPQQQSAAVSDEQKAAANEQKQPNANDYPELDLVFLMDCTGSMGSYIEQGKQSIMTIAEQVKASEKADVRFAYIAYRDHPPQDTSMVTKVHDFTTNTQTMRSYLAKYNAQGGGDGPECVTQALYEATKLDYRKNAIKIACLIADAPPHGLGFDNGDGFPNGCPNGHDPIKIAKEMAEMGIVLYVIACEPSLSNFKGAHDLMAGLAEITEGRYLPLTGAHLLPDVIIGGAKEEVSLQKLEAFVQQRLDQLKKEDATMDEATMKAKIATEMTAKGMTAMKNTVDEEAIYGAYNRQNISMWSSNAASLADGRKQYQHIAQPKANFAVQQQQMCYSSAMDDTTVHKMMKRANKKSKGAYF